jgi:hypothetical protein
MKARGRTRPQPAREPRLPAAIVDTPEEIAFLAMHFPGTYWIGAKRDDPEPPRYVWPPHFFWIHGREMPRSLFAREEPDVLPAVPACVVIGEDHRLHDRHCEGNDTPTPADMLCEVD